MARALPRPASDARPERGGLVLPGILLTLLAAGTGAGLGLTLGEIRLPEPSARASEGAPEARYGEGVALVRLRPVVANLAAPAQAWVRLDAALVVEGIAPERADALAAEVAGDLLGYLRTLTLAQIEGATGLANLREDLAERARVRSDGAARELVIETLVVQ